MAPRREGAPSSARVSARREAMDITLQNALHTSATLFKTPSNLLRALQHASKRAKHSGVFKIPQTFSNTSLFKMPEKLP